MNEQKIYLEKLAKEVLEYIKPHNFIRNNVTYRAGKLTVQGKVFNLKKKNRIIVVGAGKATLEMAESMHKLLKNRITTGYISVPHAPQKNIGPILVRRASHPLPNQEGVKNAKAILNLVKSADKDDMVICLMSGGGSALLPYPIPPLTLRQKVSITNQLLRCSADIKEINSIRKHLSLVKGGRLAQAAMPAELIAIYISDVIGDPLDVIASGPTVADKSSSTDALAVLQRCGIHSDLAEKIIKQNETPYYLEPKNVHNFIIGSNSQALKYIKRLLNKKGFRPLMLTSRLFGESREAALVLSSIAQEVVDSGQPVRAPAALIIGGETTVTVKGKGKGGRNQEFAVACLPHLPERCAALLLATDGVDGITPRPVAAVIIDDTAQKIYKKKRLPLMDYLKNNDSYHFLKQLGCLREYGETGTNVGDLIVFLIPK